MASPRWDVLRGVTLDYILAYNGVVKQDDGCWICTKRVGTPPKSYGWVCYLGASADSHRVMYLATRGEVPEKLVLHTCGKKRCVRPEHLYLGTKRDNAVDAKRLGEEATGTRHGSRTRPESTPRGDKHWAKSRPDNPVATWNQQVKCACGLISNPGAIGRHQKATGHSNETEGAS